MGFEVTVIERLDQLGSRAQTERDGFVFDAGPTVITAPFLFDELFALFDRKIEDYVDYASDTLVSIRVQRRLAPELRRQRR